MTNYLGIDQTEKTTPVGADRIIQTDSASSNATVWSTVTNLATSIFGLKTTTNLAEGTNLYYTPARVATDTAGKANKTNVLELDNTTEFTPDNDYEPATKKFVDDSISSIAMKFGGDGTDGALDTSSGTVDIDCGGATLVEKNYSSINVVTNNLTFSNPNTEGTIVIIKSQGDVTISATIDISGMGGVGGLGGVLGGADATSGTAGINIEDASTNGILGGNGATNGAAAAGGTGGAILSNTFVTNSLLRLSERRLRLFAGSGGGGGGKSAHASGGAGGNGGGGLYIECAGAIDFSGTINANGEDGVNGTDEVTNFAGGGGGGGGGAGSVIVLYNTIAANTGTINTNSGTGGDGGAGKTFSGAGDTQSGGSGGGAGGGFASAGGAGGLGSNSTSPGANGTNGSGAGGAGGGARGVVSTTSGGTGGTAVSNPTHKLITKNTVFS